MFKSTWRQKRASITSGHITRLPAVTRTCTIAFSVSVGPSGPWVTMRHAAVKWLRRPQGDPSGVWTGQKKPQDSGSSLRT